MNNKPKIFALSILLLSSMLFVLAPPMTNAQVSRDITLNIAANPNPVGLGQPIQILCWADIYPNVYVPQNLTNPTPGGPLLVGGITYARYHNYTFTITKPDGSIETRRFPNTDPLGSAYFTYSPSQVGTYTVVCKYPGDSFVGGQQDLNLPGSPEFTANAIFNPETSKTISFVVQSTQIPQWSENPVPTGYWTRPIDASNRFWGAIGGNWLSLSQGAGNNYWTNFQPYSTAPNTAHIAWANVFQNGGLVGGESGVNEYYTGESYQGKFRPVIMNGRLYYNLRVGSAVSRGFACVDIRTGETLFTRNDTTISSGFDFSLQWEDAHGTIDYLIGSPSTVAFNGTTSSTQTFGQGTTMNFYDPQNGERCFTIENVTLSGGAIIMNNTGGAGITNDMNIYYLTGNRLIAWSFFKCVAPTTGFSWSPSPTVNYNFAKGIEYNVSVAAPPNSGSFSFGSGNGGEVDGNVIIARSANTTFWPPLLYMVALRCSDGAELWRKSYQNLNDPNIWRGGGGTFLSSPGGVFLNYKKETMQVIGFDLTTGAVKYTTDPRNGSDWGSYTGGWCIDSAYGKFFVGAYDGYMMGYDIATGKLLWQYSSGNAGLETPYGTWPFFLGIPYGMYVADGKIFAPTGEHSPNDPLYRGERLHVMDANTGAAVWSIQGWWIAMGIADGYITGYNAYDGRIYSFGKGLTTTTVSATPGVAATGNKVLIQGTILDQSPGQPGTPCVSRDSMTAWMEYLHMQDPMPTGVTGVPVTLQAISADGTVTPIGTVMSDLNGYATTWNPPSEGVYTIVATFAGDDSYGNSQGSTHLSAGPAASNAPSASDVANQVVSQLPTEGPEPTAPSASDVASQVVSQLPTPAPTFTDSDLAVIAIVVIAILIGIVNLVLLLRKKQ